MPSTSFAAAEGSGAPGAYGTQPYMMTGAGSVARAISSMSAIVGDLRSRDTKSIVQSVA